MSRQLAAIIPVLFSLPWSEKKVWDDLKLSHLTLKENGFGEENLLVNYRAQMLLTYGHIS